MHELAITEEIVAVVAGRVGDAQVKNVTVVVGRLSGVVADSMRFCFDVCAAGSPLEGATLEIIDVPGKAHCRSCDDEVELDDMIALCGCGSADLEILGGQELTIQKVEVRA